MAMTGKSKQKMKYSSAASLIWFFTTHKKAAQGAAFLCVLVFSFTITTYKTTRLPNAEQTALKQPEAVQR